MGISLFLSGLITCTIQGKANVFMQHISYQEATVVLHRVCGHEHKSKRSDKSLKAFFGGCYFCNITKIHMCTHVYGVLYVSVCGDGDMRL